MSDERQNAKLLQELDALIEQQRKDQAQGQFQRPEPGVIHLGEIVGYIDNDGHTATVARFGRHLGDSRAAGKTGRKGKPRTCPHGDTYRVQNYNKGKKWGTVCRECARLRSAAWRKGKGLNHDV